MNSWLIILQSRRQTCVEFFPSFVLFVCSWVFVFLRWKQEKCHWIIDSPSHSPGVKSFWSFSPCFFCFLVLEFFEFDMKRRKRPLNNWVIILPVLRFYFFNMKTEKSCWIIRSSTYWSYTFDRSRTYFSPQNKKISLYLPTYFCWWITSWRRRDGIERKIFLRHIWLRTLKSGRLICIATNQQKQFDKKLS